MPGAPGAPKGYIGLGMPAWLREYLDAPGIGTQMSAASQRFRDVALREGPGAALRDPVATGLATQVAGNFDFTNPVGLGFAGIFAGKGAKTADLAALQQAQELAATGAEPKEIWGKTGWFKSPDGQWRFEIDDSGSRALDTPEAMGERNRAHLGNPVPQAASMERVFSHPELEQAYYPTREKAPDVYYGNIGRAKGQYTSQGEHGPGVISIDQMTALDPEAERSTMLHELQHMVQDREGFATGDNPKNYEALRSQLRRMLDERTAVAQLRNRVSFLGESPIEASDFLAAKYTGLDAERLRRLEMQYPGDELEASIQDLMKRYNDADPYESYRRSAGEAEARAVQARRDMKPEQRRASFPLDSYDVPPDRLIFRVLRP